jgi:putative toxin-antitoxin system antitoxin component (TIGR02293 family)
MWNNVGMATLGIPVAEFADLQASLMPVRSTKTGRGDSASLDTETEPFKYDLVAVERGIPLEALTCFLAESGLPQKDILEVVIPIRRLKRRRSHGKSLTVEESDKLARIVRVYSFTLEVFGDPGKAMRWLTRPKMLFDDRTPISMLKTELGGTTVMQQLWRIADGVFA